MKRLFQLLALSLLCYAAPKFCLEKTDGFKVTNIHSNLKEQSRWQTEKKATEPLSPIFSQTFFYLGSGGQAYAFVSEDGKYVVKFFKQHHWGPLAKEKKKKKLFRDFSSYKLAFEELEEETGLVFIHLNKTDHLQSQLKIVDKLNIAHTIDLDKVEFIVQKWATPSYEHLDKLAQEKDLGRAKQAIDSIVSVILSRSQKGIYDEDAKIHRNFGFIENRAIVFDVGRFKKDPRRLDPKTQKEDLKKITSRLKTHLEEVSPQLAVYLEEKLGD